MLKIPNHLSANISYFVRLKVPISQRSSNRGTNVILIELLLNLLILGGKTISLRRV